MGQLQHECGIAGIYYLGATGQNGRTALSDDSLARIVAPGTEMEVSRMIPRMLLDLQNRGQLAAGFTSYRPDRDHLLKTYKEVGSVIEAFRLNHRGKYESIMASFAGPAAIGHVRYATCGKEDRAYAQPVERHHGCKWKWFSFAFNGQLANYHDLAAELLDRENYHLVRQTDTEVILHCLCYELRNERPDLVRMFANLAEKFDGAYNLLYLNALGEMVALRDPLGFRPLCYAVNGPVVAFASESIALYNLGFSNIQSMDPGQIIVLRDGEMYVDYVSTSPRRAHCFFEWIYFANVASELDGRSVYQTRARLGRELARCETLAPDADTIVVPVPDTAKAAADAMAYVLRCPSVEGLIRNRYVGRTFIEGSGRNDRARFKYTPLRHVLAGKRVLLVEDTIVRSTTMKALLQLMRDKGGCKEIHVRVACPPIIAPCFYGIDMSTVGELFAPKFLAHGQPLTPAIERQMAVALGADSLRYLPVESLARALDLPADNLCRACVTGRYPTPVGEQLYQIALERKDAPLSERTYEHKRRPTAEPTP
jgi:amidophosphoribosyltransferase